MIIFFFLHRILIIESGCRNHSTSCSCGSYAGSGLNLGCITSSEIDSVVLSSRPLIVPRSVMRDIASASRESCSRLSGYGLHHARLPGAWGVGCPSWSLARPLGLPCLSLRLPRVTLAVPLLRGRLVARKILCDLKDPGVYLDGGLLQVGEIDVEPLLCAMDLGAVVTNSVNEGPDPVSMGGH
jgi:hypothetical protein